MFFPLTLGTLSLVSWRICTIDSHFVTKIGQQSSNFSSEIDFQNCKKIQMTCSDNKVKSIACSEDCDLYSYNCIESQYIGRVKIWHTQSINGIVFQHRDNWFMKKGCGTTTGMSSSVRGELQWLGYYNDNTSITGMEIEWIEPSHYGRYGSGISTGEGGTSEPNPNDLGDCLGSPSPEWCIKPMSDFCLEHLRNHTKSKYNISELDGVLENMRKELMVNKRSTSAFLRTRTSAPDERVSAKVTGALLGTVIFTFISLLVVCLDLPLLYRQIALGELN